MTKEEKGEMGEREGRVRGGGEESATRTRFRIFCPSILDHHPDHHVLLACPGNFAVDRCIIT
jgi:hypothetical protein